MHQFKKKRITYFLWGMLWLFAIGYRSAEAASAAKMVREGNALYKEGQYDDSAKKYQRALEKNPESDIVNFNLGTALYKKADYEKAIDHLQKVLLSEDPLLKEKAYYNMGNAFYKSGITQEGAAIDNAIAMLEKSLQQYENALSLDKKDADANYNYEFVKKELQRLREKRQEQQQQKDQPKSGSQNNEQDQKNQQSQPSESQGSQSQQGQGKDQKQKEAEQQEQESSQEQQSGQDKQEQKGQDKNAGSQGEPGQEPKDQQQATDSQPMNANELTPQEAEMLLQSYQQTEEPQGLLNVQMKRGKMQPVLKDW